MLLHLKNILTTDELHRARSLLLDDKTPWIDGRSSAGGQAVTQKQNQQLAQDCDASRALQALVLTSVRRDPLFFSATLPRKIFNPLFNRYGGEANTYGPHVDGAILHSRADQQWVRTDISCTLFLAEPHEYDGGELTVSDTYGTRGVKLPAGDLVIYPGASVHQVTAVTRGTRIAAFFWIESMVRSDDQRRLLYELDMNLLALRQRHGETEETTGLTGTYHNLLRMWAST